MNKNVIAYYPYVIGSSENAYTPNMINIWKGKYKVIPYAKDGLEREDFKKCEAIVLNWIEDKLDIKSWMLLLFYRLCGKKVIWVFHNNKPHLDDDLWKMTFRMVGITLVSSDIILHSNHSREYLKKINSFALKKARFIPHINYCENYINTQKDYRQSLGFKDDDIVFMFFGALKAYKNVELLIQVFKEIASPNIKLLIVGKASDNRYAKKIKQLCDGCSNITVHIKYVNSADVYTYFNTCDVLVLPYHKESSLNSGAMIAAFSCGKTVIVPDIAMAKDMSRFCFMYSYENEQAHKSAIKKEIISACNLGREKCCDLGEKARKYVQVKNSKEVVSKKIDILMS
mgnify:CR=1 FL=1